MTYKFGPGEYTMRNGRKAVILSDQYPCGDDYQLVGIYEDDEGNWVPDSWSLEGRYYLSMEGHDHDLMPPLVEEYMVIFKNDPFRSVYSYDTLAEALQSSQQDMPNYVGALKLTFDGDKLVASEVVQNPS